MAPVATAPTMSPASPDHHAEPSLPSVTLEKLVAALDKDLRIATLDLDSTEGPIKNDAIGWLKPLDRSMSWEDIRKQYDEDGYIFVKGLFPVDVVKKMRREYFELVSDSGILKDGSDAVDGIYCGAPPDAFGGPASPGPKGTHENSFLERLEEAHKTEFYREFHTHPLLLDFAKQLTQWDNVLLLKRHLLRINIPGVEATGVHFDQIFLRDGPPTFLTAWIPIGRCPIEGGGLIYLEKSHDIGKRMEADFAEKAKDLPDAERISAFNANMMKGGMLSHNADKFSRAEGEGRKWLIADYEDGDVVFHHPYMIHASGVNKSAEGRIRLSTDLRFVDPSEPYDRRWTQYWNPNDGL